MRLDVSTPAGYNIAAALRGPDMDALDRLRTLADRLFSSRLRAWVGRGNCRTVLDSRSVAQFRRELRVPFPPWWRHYMIHAQAAINHFAGIHDEADELLALIRDVDLTLVGFIPDKLRGESHLEGSDSPSTFDPVTTQGYNILAAMRGPDVVAGSGRTDEHLAHDVKYALTARLRDACGVGAGCVTTRPVECKVDDDWLDGSLSAYFGETPYWLWNYINHTARGIKAASDRFQEAELEQLSMFVSGIYRRFE